MGSAGAGLTEVLTSDDDESDTRTSGIKELDVAVGLDEMNAASNISRIIRDKYMKTLKLSSEQIVRLYIYVITNN